MPNTKFRFLNRTARWRAELLVAVAALPLAFAMPAAHAGRYELAKYIPTGIHVDKSPVYPENMELCKAYEANLNSFPEIKEPFACERPINPKLTDFSKPKWKELDANKHIDLLLEIARLRNRNQPHPFDEAGYRKGIQENIRQGRIRLKISDLDIVPAPGSTDRKPDGVPERVLRVERGEVKCNPDDKATRRAPPKREYFVVNRGLTEVVEFDTVGSGMDVFLYKGHVYFDEFYVTRAVDADSPDFDDPTRRQPVLSRDRYEIYVSVPRQKGASPACRYRYVE